MELRRFFVDKSDISGGFATVSGDEFNHAVKVLRHRVGFKLVLACGDGLDYLGEIVEIDKNRLKVKIDEIKPNLGAPKADVKLFQAAIKGGKTDLVVQKAVELGANEVYVFYSDNTAERDINPDRLNKIALEAAKQCHRSSLTKVSLLDSFDEAVSLAAKSDATVMAYEFEDKLNVKQFLSKIGNQKSVSVIVGSEGGFSTREAAKAKEVGIATVSLGHRILRAETAAISMLTLAMYELGELSL